MYIIRSFSCYEPKQEVEAKSGPCRSYAKFVLLKKIANRPCLVHMPLRPKTKNILVNEIIIKTNI